MAEISFGGLATGLPTEDLVKSLMAIERQPIDRLEAKKESESTRLKAYAELDTKLEGLRDAVRGLSVTSGARTTKAQLSSEESISASSNGANTGSYTIAVKQLAQVQKTVTSGFSSDTASVLGTGTFKIGNVTIAVNSNNSSLQGLAASINSVAKDTGVSASIINDGKGSNNYHIVLTGKDAATRFDIPISSLHDEVGNPMSFTTFRDAQQAVASVDGLEVVSNSNTLSGIIAGVTINLSKINEILVPATEDILDDNGKVVTEGKPAEYATTTLNVVPDSDALKEKISTFVSSYNAIMEWIVSGYEESDTTTATTDTTTETSNALAQSLRGDATVNSIKRQLQNTLSNVVEGSGSMRILSEIGISTQSDGTLFLNNSKLETTLESKFDDTVKLLAGEEGVDGVMKKFNTMLLDMTSTSKGMYADKQDRYDSAVKRLDEQISQKETLMMKIETRIRAQYNAMELLVSNLNSQGDYLTQQMDMLSNLSRRD